MATAKPPSKLGNRRNHPFDILRTRQPVIAILDQRQYDVIARKARRYFDRVLPGDVLIPHALEDANRATGLDHPAEQQVVAALLDQATRNEVRLR